MAHRLVPGMATDGLPSRLAVELDCGFEPQPLASKTKLQKLSNFYVLVRDTLDNIQCENRIVISKTGRTHLKR